jgi:hypothetical protein
MCRTVNVYESRSQEKKQRLAGKAGLKLNVVLVGPDTHNDTGRLQQDNSVVTTWVE